METNIFSAFYENENAEKKAILKDMFLLELRICSQTSQGIFGIKINRLKNITDLIRLIF